LLTPEEMVFQAAFGHELVHQEQLPVLAAVAQQPHQVGVRQSAQEVDLGLHLRNKEMHMLIKRRHLDWMSRHANELATSIRQLE